MRSRRAGRRRLDRLDLRRVPVLLDRAREPLRARHASPDGTATVATRPAPWHGPTSSTPCPTAFDDLDAAPLLCGGAIGYRSLRVAGVGRSRRHAARAVRLRRLGHAACIQVARHWGCEVSVRHPLGGRAATGARPRRGLGGRSTTTRRPPRSTPRSRSPPSVTWWCGPSGTVDRGGIVAVNAIHLDRIPSSPTSCSGGSASCAASPTSPATTCEDSSPWPRDLPLATRPEVVDLDQPTTRPPGRPPARRDRRFGGAAGLTIRPASTERRTRSDDTSGGEAT